MRDAGFTWHISQEERPRRGGLREIPARCGTPILNLDCLSPREVLSGAFPQESMCPECREKLPA